jgi:hypothetical protein
MSLAVIFKGPEGVVLAADSRVTLTSVSQTMVGAGGTAIQEQVHHSYFDNATKLLDLRGHPNLGIVTYGQGAIGQDRPRMAHGFMPEFEAHLNENGDGKPLEVEEAARLLGSFFSEQWVDAQMPEGSDPMVFQVAGFDDGAAYGRVFEVSVPNALEPVEQIADDFGVKWGGQTYLLERLMSGIAPMAYAHAQDELKLTDEQVAALAQRWHNELQLPIPYQFLPLQDCVDLATFLVDMTATVMTWTAGVQGVGGDVDVATITRTSGFASVRQKRIHPWGEQRDS